MLLFSTLCRSKEHFSRSKIGWFSSEIQRIIHLRAFIPLEPGYYEDGRFGIRLETAVLVKVAKTKVRKD